MDKGKYRKKIGKNEHFEIKYGHSGVLVLLVVLFLM